MRKAMMILMMLTTLTGCASWNWKATGQAWLDSICRQQHKQSCATDARE